MVARCERLGQCRIGRPTQVQPPAKGSYFHSIFFSPIGNRHDTPIMSKHFFSASVTPLNVVRREITVRIDQPYPCAGEWLWPNVRQEVAKAIGAKPSITYTDTAATEVFEFLVFRVEAPLLQHFPNRVFRRPL